MEQPWAVHEHVRNLACPCLPAGCHDDKDDDDDGPTSHYYHDADVARVRRDEGGHP